jgi:hypothetical protein
LPGSKAENPENSSLVTYPARKPLASRSSVIKGQLITATITKTGREVRCERAPAMYPAGAKDGAYLMFKADM